MEKYHTVRTEEELNKINEMIEQGYIVMSETPFGDGIAIRMKDPPETKAQNVSSDVNKVYEEFISQCTGLYNIKPLLTSNRKANIGARIKEHSLSTVLEMIQEAGRSDFLKGQNSKGWKANIDWIFKPTNFVKIHEGRYRSNNTEQASFVFDR